MSIQGTIKRYTLVIEKITATIHPSFQQLKEYLHKHDFEISPRTLQRDIEQIRNEFGIDIKYDRNNNGYFINKETSINIESFLRFLEIAETSNILIESVKDGKNALNYISFESEGNLKGINNLKPLLNAIKNNRKITFTHENFEKATLTKHTIFPYLLREYQSRWYVIGYSTYIKDFRTFGIDRIIDLKILAEKFKPNPKIEVLTMFDNIVGLAYSTNKIEEVILSFSPLQAKYIKALPIHKSQTIIKETSNEVQIKLIIIPNYELIQKILGWGNQIIVLQPAWLVKEIKNTLIDTVKKYK